VPGGTGWTQESQGLAEPTVLAAPADAAPPASTMRPGDGALPDGTAPVGTAGAGAADRDGLAPVTAPLPGTFYRAPRPGADPFVQVGDAVSPGTVVAIVETMKLMNPVHAGTAGRVARIVLDNGDFAPLGATLLLIEPA
jgi:acetyl-CoA carboxylase biotin carboxyl carrier protein